jgi:hypothetical protein
VLILRDVLGWSATETAMLLDASVDAVNSALRRHERRCGGTCPRAGLSGLSGRSRPSRSGRCCGATWLRTGGPT